jgi:hypothetical protein
MESSRGPSVLAVLILAKCLAYLLSGYRREWLRAKDYRYKMEAAMPRFSPVFS